MWAELMTISPSLQPPCFNPFIRQHNRLDRAIDVDVEMQSRLAMK